MIQPNVVLKEIMWRIKIEGDVIIVFIFAQENVHMIQYTCRNLVKYRGMLCILSIINRKWKCAYEINVLLNITKRVAYEDDYAFREQCFAIF